MHDTRLLALTKDPFEHVSKDLKRKLKAIKKDVKDVKGLSMPSDYKPEFSRVKSVRSALWREEVQVQLRLNFSFRANSKKVILISKFL